MGNNNKSMNNKHKNKSVSMKAHIKQKEIAEGFGEKLFERKRKEGMNNKKTIF
jgi:hypothetical protein